MLKDTSPQSALSPSLRRHFGRLTATTTTAAALACAALQPLSAAEETALYPALLSGDGVADLEETSFRSFIRAFVNGPGNILTYATLAGGPDVDRTNATGIFSNTSFEGFSTLARKGADETVNYKSFFNLVLDDWGQVFARVRLSGEDVGINNDFAIIRVDAFDGKGDAVVEEGDAVVEEGNTEFIAREGSLAPGAGDATFRTLYPQAVNRFGQIAFSASLVRSEETQVTTRSDSGVWADIAGDVTLVAREGDIAAGFDFPQQSAEGDIIREEIVTYGHIFHHMVVDSMGEIAFSAILNGRPSGFNRALFAGQPGFKKRVIQIGDPETPEGESMTYAFPLRPVAFSGDYAPVEPIQIYNEPAAQEQGGEGTEESEAVFYSFGPASINNLGDLAFTAHLSRRSEGVGIGNDLGLWFLPHEFGTLEFVAREGDPAPFINELPETPDQESPEIDVPFPPTAELPPVFKRFREMIVTNESLVFRAYVSGEGIDRANDESLWRYRSMTGDLNTTETAEFNQTITIDEPPTPLTCIVREGDYDPNTGAWIQSILQVAADEYGAVVFLARLTGDERSRIGRNNIALYVDYGYGYGPQLVLQKGDDFDLGGTTIVEPGLQGLVQEEEDIRVVSSIAFGPVTLRSGAFGGFGEVFNGDGQLAVRLGFTRGRGIFMVDLPDPLFGGPDQSINF